ncbi:MAG: hypothetical protein EOP48_09805 [Sphingobacteriales bacterium]|nr:MAG: hypothetical protein EOP48_09805 [Sphingobacteriales bacterium]
MASRREKRFLLISIACVIAVIGYFVMSFNKQTDRTEAFSPLISQLEDYKTKHGLYPLILDSIAIKVDEDVYYSVDSARQSFNLAYTEGIMNASTISYRSTTRRWEKKFNY